MSLAPVEYHGPHYQSVSLPLPHIEDEFHVVRINELRSHGRFRTEVFHDTVKLSLHFVHAGRGTLMADGREHAVAAPAVMAFFPEGHFLQYDRPEAPWHYHWLNFRGARAVEFVRRCGFSPEAPVLSLGHGGPLEEVKLQWSRFRRGTAFTPCEGNLLAWNVFQRLLQAAGPAEAARTPLAEQVKQYVDLDLRHDTRIKELSALFGVNRSTLYRAFSARYGRSLKDYLTEKKMGEAATLLRRGGLSVRRIAEALHFSSPQHFIGTFTRHFGVSPGAYGKQARNAGGP